MDLRDCQDSYLESSLALTGVSTEISAKPSGLRGLPQNLRCLRIFQHEQSDLRPLWCERVREWAGNALKLTGARHPTLTPFDCLESVSGVNVKGWRGISVPSDGEGISKLPSDKKGGTFTPSLGVDGQLGIENVS